MTGCDFIPCPPYLNMHEAAFTQLIYQEEQVLSAKNNLGLNESWAKRWYSYATSQDKTILGKSTEAILPDRCQHVAKFFLDIGRAACTILLRPIRIYLWNQRDGKQKTENFWWSIPAAHELASIPMEAQEKLWKSGLLCLIDDFDHLKEPVPRYWWHKWHQIGISTAASHFVQCNDT